MQRGEQIPEGGDPVSLFFAGFSEMIWAFHTIPDPAKDSVEVPILAGVTLYLPEKRVILAIETKGKHEEITKSMKERHYLENPSPGSPDKISNCSIGVPRVISSRVSHHPAYGSVQGGSNQTRASGPKCIAFLLLG